MRKKIILTLTASAIYFSSFAQCSVIEVPLQQRANASDLIIEGKVIAKNSFWNADHNMIYTSNTIDIYKIFKGNISASTIELMTVGGIVGDQMIKADPSLTLNVDEAGIFTCENLKRFKIPFDKVSSVPQYEAYASVQGFIKYNLNDQTANDVFRTYSNIQNDLYPAVLSPSSPTYQTIKPIDFFPSSSSLNKNVSVQTGLSISSFSPTTVSSGTFTLLTINGSGFGNSQLSGSVGFKNADNGGSSYILADASNYVSWTDTQIKVYVPCDASLGLNAGTGTIQVTQGSTVTSLTPLTISYAEMNVVNAGVVYQTKHINDNLAGGYTWQMNPGFDGDALARPSFMRAFDSWRCATGINWTIGATTSINNAVSDGTNCICYDNTNPLSAGILGVCYSYWSACGSPLKWYVSELDIIFDDGSNLAALGCTWQFGPAAPSGTQYDFESVCVHELGHGHQMGHVIQPGAIMHYALSNGAQNRTPGVNDLAAANDVQSRSIVASGCGPGAMTNYSCGLPPVANFSGTPTTLCAGRTVTYTDISSNAPTSWAWTFTGGTPSTSSSQNPTITYNTAGTYAVSLTATNGSGNDTKTVNGYITVNANPSGSASITNVTCNGGNNGAIDLTPSGGLAPYTFLWNPSGQTTEDRNALAAATYSVTITDNHGCTATVPFTVSQPTAVNASMSMTSSTCPNNDGTANATPSGGTAPYTYLWTPGGQTTQTATGLSAATYSCTVTDNVGCSTSGNIAVTTTGCGTPPVANFSGAPTTLCAGGTVSFTDLSLNVPTSWAWTFTGGAPSSSSSQNPSIVYNTAGTYAVSLTATNGSGNDTKTVNGYITVNANPSGSGLVTNVSCNGGNNGSIDLTPSGGQAPYTFLWNPSGQTTEDRNTLTATSYSVTITDNNGCTATIPFTVSQPTVLSAAMSMTSSTCPNNDGTAKATPSGGTAPYTYVWSPGGQTTQTATGLSAATYSCTVTDNHGCSRSGNITVTTLGCIPTTHLNTASCGITETSLNQTLNCVAVSGANDYQYRINGPNVSNFIYTRGNNATVFYMYLVWGVQYGGIYTVEVRAKIGSVWGNYSTVCNVTTPPTIPLTQLASGSCGISETSLTQTLNCVAVSGANNYQYRINGPNVSNFIYTRGNNATVFYMYWVWGVQYGATYSIEVRAQAGTVWGAYGPACNVTTPATIPLTELAIGSCGISETSLSQALNCDPVSGAMNYQYRVNGPNVNNFIYTRGNSATIFYMSWITGVQHLGTYTVEVRANAGGIWGTYGPICTINTPLHDDPNQQRIENPDQQDPSVILNVAIFPNPFTDNLTITSDQEMKNVFIMNTLGENVYSTNVSTGAQAELSLTSLLPGIYFIRIETTQGPVIRKIIKQ